MDRWADVRFGSIYAGLRKLRDEGFLEEAGHEQEGRGPPRTLYRITPEGRRERDRLLRDLLARPRLSADPVDAALSFFFLLPEEDLGGLLAERLQDLRDRLDRLAEARRESDRAAAAAAPATRAVIDALFEHSRMRLGAELDWSEKVRERILEGLYRKTPTGGEHGSGEES